MKTSKTGALKRFIIIAAVFAVIMAVIGSVSLASFAAESTETIGAIEEEESSADNGGVKAKAFAACIAVGIASAAGAIGMAIVIAKSAESMARQQEASDKINSAMMLGLVFIETTCIYALIAAILVIFVL